LIYKDKSYSRVKLIVEFDKEFYIVNTFITNGRDSLSDMFSSLLIPQMLDIIYSVPKGEFIKFKRNDSFKKEYMEMFKTLDMKIISMMELASIISNKLNCKIKIYNEAKWQTLTTQA